MRPYARISVSHAGSVKRLTQPLLLDTIPSRLVYHLRPLPTRRRSTLQRVRASASEAHKSLELEHRVSRLEVIVKELRATIDVNLKRMAAMQAELDHVDAKLKGR